MGRPWCGKGTLCREMVNNDPGRFTHFDMGQALRDRAASDPAFAELYQKNESGLVPDKDVFDTIGLSLTGCKTPCLLMDGIPRRLTQGHEMLDFLKREGFLTPLVLHVNITEEIAFERLRRNPRKGRIEQRLTGAALRSYFQKRMYTFQQETWPVICAFKDYLLINRVRTIQVREVDPGKTLIPVALAAISS